MTYAMKAMIRSSMALGVDGSFQLFPHLQKIVAKYEPLTQYLIKPHLVWKKCILSLPNANVENGMFLIMYMRF